MQMAKKLEMQRRVEKQAVIQWGNPAGYDVGSIRGMYNDDVRRASMRAAAGGGEKARGRGGNKESHPASVDKEAEHEMQTGAIKNKAKMLEDIRTQQETNQRLSQLDKIRSDPNVSVSNAEKIAFTPKKEVTPMVEIRSRASMRYVNADRLGEKRRSRSGYP